MTTRRICTLVILTLVSVNGLGQSPQVHGTASEPFHNSDGKWWLSIDSDERSGFINGAADCLTWSTREEGFNGTPEQLVDKITKFYKAHPEAVTRRVVDVWREVAKSEKYTKTPKDQGETWKNAHWYLNGDWWGQINRWEEDGYIEGYLWCIDNRVVPKTDSYSQSVSFYRKKIDAYLETHPKAGNEAVAVILSKFRDIPNGTKSDTIPQSPPR